jgi:hypothetical protein
MLDLDVIRESVKQAETISTFQRLAQQHASRTEFRLNNSVVTVISHRHAQTGADKQLSARHKVGRILSFDANVSRNPEGILRELEYRQVARAWSA